MKKVKVTASKEYEVIIGNDLLDNCGEYIRAVVKSKMAAIITDDIVDELYASRVEKSLTKTGFEVKKYVFKNGEQSKNSKTYIDIVNYLAKEKLTRSDVVIALGGGVVGDMAGFASATYLRGVKFVQIPTTLLAAVDSSVGGKTAIDLDIGKNLVGAFYQPSLVICDYSTLDTLNPKIFSDGCAEVIKYGMISSFELFEKCKRGIKDDIEDIITECVTIKRDIVMTDEYDTGIRQLLNFGHTIGHGIEVLSDFKITHGYAVAIGMVAITKAAIRLNWCNEDILEDLIVCLENNGLPSYEAYKQNELYKVMLSDKKIDGTKINLVVPTRIGDAYLKKVDTAVLKEVLEVAL